MTKSPKGVLALSPAPPAGEAKDDELPGMLAVAKGVSEQTFPHTMDAKVWADEFCKLFHPIDRNLAKPAMNTKEAESLMVSWFANAIMAGYDTAAANASSTGQAETPPPTPPAVPDTPPEGKDADGAGWKWLRVVLKNHLPAVEFKLWEQLDAEQRKSAARLQGELAEAQVQAACWRKFVSLQTGDVTQLCHRAERAEAAERTVRELRAHIRRMGDSATDMFEQMLRGKWVDDHGHDVRMNKAMAELCEAVKLATPITARET